MKTAAEWIENLKDHPDCQFVSAPVTLDLVEAIQKDVLASIGYTSPFPGEHGLPDPFPGVPLGQLEQRTFPADYIGVHPRRIHDEVLVAAVDSLNAALAGKLDTDIRVHWTNIRDNETNPLGETGRLFIRLTRVKKGETGLEEMTRQRDEARAHAEQFRRYIRDAAPDAILPLFLPWDYLNQTTP